MRLGGRFFPACLWTGLSVAMLAGCSTPSAPPGGAKAGPGGRFEVVVGANLELSGAIAQWGKESKQGMELAVGELNGDPKNTFLIKMIYEDNASVDAKSKDAVSKLIRQDGAKVVVGSVASNKTLAAIETAAEEKIPLVTHASTNVTITQKGGPYVFRICFNDKVQGSFMAGYALDELMAKSAVLIVQKGNAYSEGLVQEFQKVFTAGGGQVLATEAYQEGDTDFQTLAVKIKAAHPDCVWLPGYFNEVALIIKQARANGVQKPFLGTDGWDNPALYTLGGPSIKDNFFCNHFDPGDSNPKVREFTRKYEARFKEKPGAMAALGYEVICCVGDAVRRAGQAEPEAIRKGLETIQDLETVCGRITMGPDHEVTKPVVLLKTGENGHIFVKRLEPTPPAAR
jgi:branched-chain amino acid transport system substrate-binding protein